jgi:hypothetical protein
MAVTTFGFDRVIRGPVNIASTIERETDKALNRIIDHVVPNVQKHTPVGATGKLRAAVEGRIEGFLKGKAAIIDTGDVPGVITASVEGGARPHWPPWGRGSDVERWAEHKGIPVFLVAQAIAERGTIKRFGYKGASMFEKGLEDSRPVIDAEASRLGKNITAEMFK